MRHSELIVPFMCACVIWCPFSWAWWAYWQGKMLEHLRKNHNSFARTVLWKRKRSFFINMGSIYWFTFSKNDLGDEYIGYLKTRLRPAVIGFLGGQFLATAYTFGVILAIRVFQWL